MRRMADSHIKCFLLCAAILLIRTTTGSYQDCISSLQNIVLYEGTLNTLVSCTFGPNGTAWTVLPTSNSSRQYPFIKFNDSVASSLSGIFAFNQSGLILRNATTTASGYDVSTAGVYLVSFDPANLNGNRTAFKVVVIRSGPTCSCVQLSNGDVNVACTIIYADHPSTAIMSTMSCTANGQNYNATTSQRTLVSTALPYQYVWNSTSTVSAKDIGPTTFECVTTFAAPLNPVPYLAKNAPDFNATTEVSCGLTTAAIQLTTTTVQPTTATKTTTETTQPKTTNNVNPSTSGAYAQCSPQNIVVYEGTLNTLISCSTGPNSTAWSVRPTSSVTTAYAITSFDDTVAPTLTGLYAFNQTGLVIRNTTTVNDTNGPSTTAGVYFVSFDSANVNGNRTAFKVVVIRSGPTCSCVQLSNGNVSVSCSIIYADHPSYPIMAMMSCSANGQSYNATAPTRTLLPSPAGQIQYVWNSTSTVTAKDIGPTTYDCFTTFAAPLLPVPYMAKNAPDFNATTEVSCDLTTVATQLTTTTVQPTTATKTTTETTQPKTTNVNPSTSVYCSANMRNMAVREGTLDVPLNVSASPCGVTLIVFPTTDEMTPKQIIGPDCSVDQGVAGLFYVNRSNVIVLNSTATSDNGKESTAGLYTANCTNTGTLSAAKLLVVHSGPDCSCIAESPSSIIQLSCTASYAENQVYPMPPILTWFINGAVFQTDQLTGNKTTDSSYYIVTSTISIDGSTVNNYQCTLTFGAPINGQTNTYNLATNAPDFNASCSTTPVCTTNNGTAIPPIAVTQMTGGSCTQTTASPSVDQSCSKTSECQSDGTNLTDIYDECVVKAELYARCNSCCPDKLVCGVVVTLRNDTRWLIHDSVCDDNKCQMVVVDASCMSSEWKLLHERKVIISGVGDYVKSGNSVDISANATDCSDSCQRMMSLP